MKRFAYRGVARHIAPLFVIAFVACGPPTDADEDSGHEGASASRAPASTQEIEDARRTTETADTADTEPARGGDADDPGGLQAACFRGDREACDQMGH